MYFFSSGSFIGYLKNISWLMLERVLRIFAAFFVGMWVARYLGPVDFGALNYLQSLIGLFFILATLGLDEIVIKELVEKKFNEYEIVGTAAVIKLVGSLLCIIAVLVFIYITRMDSYLSLLLFILSLSSIFYTFNVIDMYFQSKVLVRYIAFVNIICLSASTCIKIYLILLKAPLIGFIWCFLFDSIFLALLYLFFFMTKTTFRIMKLKFNIRLAFFLLKNSWPLAVSSIVITVYMRIDQIMLKEMLGSDVVGQYAAAIRISESWYFIPVTVVLSFFPAIINAKSVSDDFFYERVKKLYFYIIIFSLFVAIITTFTSDYVIKFLYGYQYNQTPNILIVHVWTGIFVASGVVTSKIIVVNKTQLNGMICTFIGMVTNVILNYILIPVYGAIGAAVATIVAQFVSGFMVPVIFRIDRKYPMIVFKSLLYGVKI